MWLHSCIWHLVLVVGSATGGRVGAWVPYFPVAFHPLIGMAGLFHMIEEMFQKVRTEAAKSLKE